MFESEKLGKDVENIKNYLWKFGKFMNRQWKVCYIMFFVFTGFIFLMALMLLVPYTDDEFTVYNTKEYTATVSKIQVFPQYSILVQEYNAALVIGNSDMVLDFDALGELFIGQTITFRVSNDSSRYMNMITEQLELVALEVGGTEIITLDSVNDYYDYNDLTYGGAIAMIVMGALMLGLGLWFRKIYKDKQRELEILIGKQDSLLNELTRYQ